ncbi:RHS repeat domain-containing protein [Flavobacterium aquatile]|uniref:YD repeat-containing protein n=1 Tax=Flavobacterium aquatile LMG 4008 = ATCC 11947 TaxID=1453498 RepID=A0A095SXN2_9FLAO|nr:RHS repeat domain-containing protein [Flavobacterium aquatile]KGD69332.1 hypothetical protein LG45_00700 [Flavobacterium aquatile LMG 4008 = ATCC 11947]OXA66215.1 hypothetical protein B0A61_13180 [Flavobacterium aquatile LMG 4008 = ATCC 11947]GEC77709.1 hypothetical protein FAQ01_05790 [Flavobacterium aquatile]
MKYNKNNIAYLIITYMFFLSNLVNAQFAKRPDDLKSPDAASLGRYGEQPVSYAYGTVAVNVPIYTMTSNGPSYNIGLNYDTSGLVINSPSGTVGSNWSLSSKGVITRAIKGTADEIKNDENPAAGHFYTYSVLNRTDIETNSGLQSFNNSIDGLLQTGTTDYEPDIFTFNFMGMSGRFFLGQDGTWKVQSDSNLSVTINESDFRYPINGYSQGSLYFKSIGKITIKDDQGNMYVFGATDNSVEYTTANFYNQLSPRTTHASAWYLDSVIDRLGNNLYSFNYFRAEPISQIFTYTNDMQHLDKVSGNLISPVYLSSAISTNESLSFSYSNSNALNYSNETVLQSKFAELQSTGNLGVFELLYTNFYQNNPYTFSNWNQLCNLMKWKKLNSITVYKNNGVLDKIISFEFEDKPSERLFLKKVKFEGKSLGITDGEYEYKFTYNAGNDSDYNFTGDLPNLLFRGVDHWGYYNRLIEGGSVTYPADYLAYRETNSNPYFGKIGVLRKIIYPTGGISCFEFEKNTYSKYMAMGDFDQIYPAEAGTSFYTGGLRIKSILNQADQNTSNVEITNYKYTNDYFSSISSGILEMRPFYFGSLVGDVWTGTGNYTFSSIDNFRLINYSGPHIIYSKVFETKTTSEGTFYTEYNFTDNTNFPDTPFLSTVYPNFMYNIYAQRNSRIFMRGKMLSKFEYNKDHLLTRSTLYIYRNDNATLESQYVKGFQLMQPPHNLYKIYYGDYDVVKEIVREFNLNGTNSLMTEVNYNISDFPYKNTSIPVYTGFRRNYGSSRVNSEGQIITNNIAYEFDCPLGTNCYQNPFGLIKSSTNFKNSSQISKETLSYNTINSIPTAYVVNEVNKYRDTDISISKMSITKLNSKGLPTEVKSNDGIFTSYIYGYSDIKIVAKVEGITNLELGSNISNIMNLATGYYGSLGETGNVQKELDLRNALNTLRNSFPNAMITTYTYDSHLRLKTLTLPNSYVEFYFYDGLDRLVKVTDKDGNILKAHEYHFKN